MRDEGRRLLGPSVGLCTAFLLSGTAGLVFETVWFRHANLALGNSVWASSAVLASFMGGLALGNVLAARLGERVPRPLRLYAALEVAVAFTGLSLVVVLPRVAPVLAPLLGRWSDEGWLLGGARFSVAFALMLVPTAAMGTTLPLLARALVGQQVRFGVALGRLYGWNTLGGVLGAVLGESVFIPTLGLRGAAAVAAGLNVTASLIALSLEARWSPSAAGEAAARPASGAGRGGRIARLLFAAFVGGGILLALEVVWVRLLQLFVFGTSIVFALMLATVLAGIGLGGLAGAAWVRRRPAAFRHLAVVALGGGLSTIFAYSALDPEALVRVFPGDWSRTVILSLCLMFPTSLVSGVLFTLLGEALRHDVEGDSETAGWLTLANTVGAMLGALLAGLVLLPRLGIETSLFALALAYVLAAAAVLPWRDRARAGRYALGAGAVAFAFVAALFPFGLMRGRFLKVALASHGVLGARLVAFREGLTETALLLEKDWGGRPLQDHLVTNAYSMTSTTFYGRRYMKLFAYWALALRPEARRALLISYGLGNTGEALVHSDRLRSIDVVDISATVFELSSRVPRPVSGDPLRDPRVHAHVEDGRFFLLGGRDLYDLVTAEPPPPRGAGIVNLYSREYFGLVRRRLKPGGIVTYWLPVNQLSVRDAQGIVRAFCAVFEDCSLWDGAGYDWMLAGTNGMATPPAETAFARLWSDPGTGDDLRDLGIETPEQLGALFIDDAAGLARWTAGVPPLTDDRPGRLSQHGPPESDRDVYRRMKDARSCAERFRASSFIDRVWPPAVRARTMPWFRWQAVMSADYDAWARPTAIADLWDVLASTSLRTLPLLLVDSEPRIRAIARIRYAEGDRNPVLSQHLGVAALADRDYARAADDFEDAQADSGLLQPPALLRALALGLGGRPESARQLLDAIPPGTLPSYAEPWRASLLAKLPSAGSPKRTHARGRSREPAPGQ
jgi:spermidine synthase